MKGNKLGKRILSFLVAMVMLLGMIPASAVPVKAAEKGTEENPYMYYVAEGAEVVEYEDFYNYLVNDRGWASEEVLADINKVIDSLPALVKKALEKIGVMEYLGDTAVFKVTDAEGNVVCKYLTVATGVADATGLAKGTYKVELYTGLELPTSIFNIDLDKMLTTTECGYITVDEDNRHAVEIQFAECLTAAYGITLETLTNEIVNKVTVVDAVTGEVVADAKEKLVVTVTGYDKETDLIAVGEQTVTLHYGNMEDSLCSPGTAFATLTVTKACASVEVVTNGIETYDGNAKDVTIIAKPENEALAAIVEGIPYISFIAGFGAVETEDGTNLGASLQLVIDPELLFPGMESLQAIANKVIDAVEGKALDANALRETLEKLTINMVAVDSLLKVFAAVDDVLSNDMPVMVSITNEYPSKAGVYVIGAVTTDDNFETAMGMNYLVIKPALADCDLEFDYQSGKKIATISLDKIEELLGVTATEKETGAVVDVEAGSLFFGIGVDVEGRELEPIFKFNTVEEMEIGAYTQIAFLLDGTNTIYYAEPIVRAIVVGPALRDVEISVEVNGEDKDDFVINYGDDYDLDIVTKENGTEVNDADKVVIIYGNNANAEYRHEINVDFPADVDKVLKLVFPKAYTTGITSDDFFKKYNTMIDMLDKFKVDTTALKEVKAALEDCIKVNVTFVTIFVDVDGFFADYEEVIDELKANGSTGCGDVVVEMEEFKAMLKEVAEGNITFDKCSIGTDAFLAKFEALIAKIDAFKIDTTALKELYNKLYDVLSVRITFKETELAKPTEIGVYKVIAMVVDCDCQFDKDVATITIKEKEKPVRQIIDRGRTLSLIGKVFINQYVELIGFEGVEITEENSGLLIWTQNPDEVESAPIVKKGLIKVGDKYAQQTDGFAAAEYADEVWLKVFVETEEGTYYSALKEFSVQDYCEAVIERATAEKEVAIAMLHYGAAAQLYFDYNVEDLANANITETVDAYDEGMLDALDAFETNIVASSDVEHKGKTLSLDDATMINYYYAFAGNATKAELLFWDGVTGELTTDNVSYTKELELKANGYYAAQSEIFPAALYGKTIYACAHFVDENGADHYSDVIAFSPEAYAAAVINNEKADPELQEAMERMVVYGEYARIFFGE